MGVIPLKRFQIDEPYFRFDILKRLSRGKPKKDRYSRVFQFRYYTCKYHENDNVLQFNAESNIVR